MTMTWYKGKHTRQMTKNEVVAALDESQRHADLLAKELSKVQGELAEMRNKLTEHATANDAIYSAVMLPILSAAKHNTASYKQFVNQLKRDLSKHIDDKVDDAIRAALEQHVDDYVHERIEPYSGY